MAHGTSLILERMTGTLGQMVIYQSGGQTVIRRKVNSTSGGGTIGQQTRRRAVAGLGATWRGLDPRRQVAWARLALRMPDWDDARLAKKLTGYQCFLGVNTGRDALGLPPLLDAPDAPDLPPFLPLLTLSATSSGSPLSLVLTCGGTPFASPVQIFAAKPALPGAAPPRVKDTARLIVLPGLPAGGVDLGAPYLAKFRAVVPGLSVTLRAVPLSPTGFRGQALSVSAVVGERPLHAAREDA